MDELSREQIKKALEEVLEERSRINPDEHREHHEWVFLQIEKEREKLRRKQEWTKTITAARTRVLEWSVYALAFCILTKLITGKWPDSLPGG